MNTPPRSCGGGSVDRQVRLAGLGRELLRARRILRNERPGAPGGQPLAGKGAEALGLAGPIDLDNFRQILEGKAPDGPRLGKRGDERIVGAHDKAVGNTLAWIGERAVLLACGLCGGSYAMRARTGTAARTTS